MVVRLRRLVRWWYKTDWAIGLTVFLIAVIPRLIPSGMFMDPDSATLWIGRTRGFLEALQGGDPNLFAPSVHPGVPLMWLTAAGLGWWKLVSGFFSGPDQLEAFTWMVKVPLALVTSGLAVGAWRYLRRWAARPVAILTAAIFALDPLYLVFSRYQHLDALVTGFVFVGLIATWSGITQRRFGDLAVGSALLVLGILTRLNGGLAIVVAAIGLAFFWPRGGKRKAWLVFCLSGSVTALIVWPAILFGPQGIIDLLNNRIGLALVPHEVAPNVDVIPWVRGLLYPLFILTREFPLLLGLAAVGVVRLWRGRTPFDRFGQGLTIFSLAYYAMLLALPKDLDRYALPLIGPLALFSAQGMLWMWSKLPTRVFRSLFIGLMIFQLILFYRLGPYFQTYQNFLTNLARQTPLGTSQALDPAWGEGISEAVAYLKNGQPTLPPTAAWFAGVACYYGSAHKSTEYPFVGRDHLACPPGLRWLATPQDATYLILSRDQIAQRIYPKLLDDIDRLGWQPEKVISINGVPHVYIYRNQGGLAKRYKLTDQ